MSRRADLIILCEDIQQRVFFERLLRRLGHDGRTIRVRGLPGGGSAEQYVRSRYPVEVRSVRGRSTHSRCCLVVAVDADRNEVQFRYDQLDRALTEGGLTARQQDDPIAVFVPKWHIETWIHYLLDGGAVSEDEPSAYLDGRETDCYPAVDRFVELARPETVMPEECPPSLRRGLTETPRIPK